MLFEYFYMKERQNVYNTTYYIVKACFFAKRPKYPMGILWLWYGYPMVRVVFYPYFTITCPLFYAVALFYLIESEATLKKEPQAFVFTIGFARGNEFA